jgi:chromosome segregation ATPase
MAEFSDRARNIQDAAENMLQAVRAQVGPLLAELDDADLKFEEQANLIASLQETVRMQQAEIERISTDFQDKVDRRDDEITALRSRAGEKDKNFSILSRAVGDMMTSAKRLAAVGAHAFNIINRDAVGDRIVTQLRGHPQRPQRPQETPSGDDGRIDDDPYAPRQRAAR